MKVELWVLGAIVLLALGLLLGIFPHKSSSTPTPAQALTPQAALERLFTVKPVQSEWFSAQFLAKVPVPEMEQILSQLEQTLGSYLRVEVNSGGHRGQYLVIFQKGLVPSNVSLDAQGQFVGLWFFPPQLQVGSLKKAMVGFKGLPGKVSVLVLEDGKPRVALQPAEALAVGSSFKLAVLAALQEQIEVGQRSWLDLVRLQTASKSLPTGILQTWPDGTPLTLQTLATLMISQSDNTAADTLIRTLGQAALARYAGKNQPLLTTREAFVLKDPKNSSLLAQYLEGNETERETVLKETASRPLPPVSLFSKGAPVALKVEWFFSVRELCGLMAKVEALPLMSVNPGVADPSQWAHLAYKGGSEPGVLNLTTWIQGKEGHAYCVSASWNDDRPLDETRFTMLYSGLLQVLAGKGS